AATPTAAPLRTRLAVINMNQILKNYEKFKNAEADLKAQIQQVEKDMEPKKGELLKMRNEYATCNDSGRRDQLERDVKRLQATMQEMDEDARKRLSKTQGEMAVQIYHEVEDAVRDFARVNDIEMVLLYNDAPKTEQTLAEFYNPGNIRVKLTT